MKTGPSSTPAADQANKVTQTLVEQALAYRFDTLPPDVIMIAKQCILDWFAVTIAGCAEPVHGILLSTEHPGSGQNGYAHVIGQSGRYTAQQAALINGTTAHALDFDDVNLSISGHPTAVIFSALLALAQQHGKGGKELIAAFVAGYETACRVGRLLAPGHLAQGYHATGTICTFGAAAACAHLLGLNPMQTASVLGIAGTQAAGLKAMFGTMAKPLHAGLAARNGLAAAILVQHGLDGPVDIFEHGMGFSPTHSQDFNASKALGEPDQGFHIRNNLFKFDASCFGTIATLECIRQIKQERPIVASEIKRIAIHADRTVDSICNIQRPRTGTEAKFSLRQNAAYALAGWDTGKAETYNDALANDKDVIQLREKVDVILMEGWPPMQAKVEIETLQGQRYSALVDAGMPSRDLHTQGERLEHKFFQLASPLLGQEVCKKLAGDISGFERLENLGAKESGGSARHPGYFPEVWL